VLARVTRAKVVRSLKRLRNAALLAVLAVLIIDGSPATSRAHQRLKGLLEPTIERAGLAQGSWKLFGPDIDHVNTWVEAIVTYSDGHVWRWRTPDWQRLGWFERLRRGRESKFADYFRMDQYSSVWPSLSRHVLTLAPPTASTVRATKIELVRHWWQVPAPDQLGQEARGFSSVPPPQREFTQQFSFYTQELR
jgi:hypothetical protein